MLLGFTGCSIDGSLTSQKPISSEVAVPTYLQSLDPDMRVDLAKKRKNYISGIRKWDYYSLRNNPEEALKYYLTIAEKIPNDQIIRKKIAHVYFLQKNWKAAYMNYILVPIEELTDLEKNEMFQSLFFDDSQLDRIGEVQKIPSSTGSREYYRVIDTCYWGIHNCIIAIEWYSGDSLELLDLKKVIQDAAEISPDFQYRNLSVAAKFYELNMYGVSSRFAEQILKIRPDYYEVQKLLWFTYAELWKYGDSKKYLLEYIEKNPNDLETIIRIGEVYSHLGDIVSSNLFYNNALIAGYTPKTDIERHLAYNYSILGDSAALIRVMNYLLQEKDVREDDFAVGISIALSEGELKRAQMWTDAWLAMFPWSRTLIPLAMESYRLTGNRDAAQMLAENGDQVTFSENPNFLLQKWILLFDQEKYDDAKKIFETLWDREEWPEISLEAQTYIRSIENIESASGSLF